MYVPLISILNADKLSISVHFWAPNTLPPHSAGKTAQAEYTRNNAHFSIVSAIVAATVFRVSLILT